MPVSDKQRHILRLGDRAYFHSFLVGPYGTGKSTWGLRGSLAWLAEYHGGKMFLVGAKKQDIFQHLHAGIAREFCQDYKLHYDIKPKSWEIESDCPGGAPNLILPVIYASGDVAADRFQAHNVVGGFWDEATIMPTSVRKQAVARSRDEGDHRLVWAMNPDSEHHPMKLYIDEQTDAGLGEEITMSLADNPGLTDDWKRQLVMSHTEPHERERYVFGRWATASGLIFKLLVTPFEDDGNLRRMPPSEAVYSWHVGIDWASKRVIHAALIANTPKGLWIVDEFRHDRERDGDMSDRAMVDKIISYFGVGGRRSVASWVFDQSSGEVGEILLDRVTGAIIASEGTWDDHRRIVQVQLNAKRLWLDPRVAQGLREANAYKYPTKEQQIKQASLRPSKTSDFGWHFIDAAMYLVAELVGSAARGGSRIRVR